MKLLLSVCVSSLLISALHAQESVLPQGAATPATAPANTPAPTAPPLLAPDILPLPATKATPPADLPSIPQLDQAFQQNPLNSTTEQYRQRIEYRKLRNAVANDPALKTALRRAQAARADLEKRQLLRDYYELYFNRVSGLAATPEMKAYVAARKAEQLAGLAQPHVRPELSMTPRPVKTVAIAPPPEPALPAAEEHPSPKR